MPSTYTLIASNTVGSGGASSITFSSIPSTYTDLVIKTSARSTNALSSISSMLMRFNGSSSSYTDRRIVGSGASASSDSNVYSGYIYLGEANGGGSTASTFGNTEFYIPNYTSANFKSVSTDNVQENNNTTAYAQLIAGLWSNTAAITSIEIFVNGTTFGQYSTFYLYGIKNS